MAVKILSKDKKLEATFNGTKFFYKNIPAREYAHIERNLVQHIADKVVFNAELVGLQTLEWGLLGWDNLFDSDNNIVQFDKNLIQYLPPEVRARIVKLIKGDLEIKEEEKENLGDTSGGN